MQVTCDSGFVIDGKSGETTSALSCDESGTIVGSQECVPVICKVPETHNSTYLDECRENVAWTHGKRALVLPPNY